MKKYILSLVLLIPFFTSCTDWLDVTPKQHVLEEDLLKDSQGYSGALAGVYYKLTDAKAFGGRFTFLDADILGQYWIPPGTSYTYLYDYEYAFADHNSYFNEVWSTLYGIVGGANLIIEAIQKNGNSIQYSDLIEGEAIGLRALAHFELFRLFGPVLLEPEDLSKECIIYRKKFNTEYVDFITTEEVLDEIKTDLLRAKELLEKDPIRISGGRSDDNSGVMNFNDILYYRVSRMNYYAVVGLLIRLEMYLKNEDQAYAYIEELLEELKGKSDVKNHIKFVDVAEMLGSRPYDEKDTPFSSEFLFSFYYNDLYEYTKVIFGNQGRGEGAIALDQWAFTYMTENVYQGVKGGSGSDIRYKCWFKQKGMVNSIYEIQKFLPSKILYISSSDPTIPFREAIYPYQPEIGYITLGEIYLTAFECQIGKDNKLALKYLNTLRKARNLDEMSANVNYSDEELYEQLLLESKKEYLASGRLFHLHKRLYKPITKLTGLVVPPSRKIFEFPIPNEESIYKD